MVDQRTGILENNVDEKINNLEEQVVENQSIAGSGGRVDMEEVASNLSKFKSDNKRSQNKIDKLGKKLDNFRNEVNRLLADFETETSNKQSMFSTAIGEISRQLGIQNPLI